MPEDCGFRVGAGVPAKRPVRLAHVVLVQLDRLVQRLQQAFAYFQLGVLVRQHVQLLQFTRRRQCRFLQLLGRHHLVEEAGIDRRVRVEHLGVDHRAVEG